METEDEVRFSSFFPVAFPLLTDTYAVNEEIENLLKESDIINQYKKYFVFANTLQCYCLEVLYGLVCSFS